MTGHVSVSRSQLPDRTTNRDVIGYLLTVMKTQAERNMKYGGAQKILCVCVRVRTCVRVCVRSPDDSGFQNDLDSPAEVYVCE